MKSKKDITIHKWFFLRRDLSCSYRTTNNIPSRHIVLTLFLIVLLFFTSCSTCKKYDGPLVYPEPSCAKNYKITHQPLHDYNISYEAKKMGACDLNPMRYFTRIGTDYGLMGTEKRHMRWLKSGQIQANLKHDQWSGVWHSMEGLACQKMLGLRFDAVYPRHILPEYQPKVVGAYIKVRGEGTLKLEIKKRDPKGNEILKPLRMAGKHVETGPRFQTFLWPRFKNGGQLIPVDDLSHLESDTQILKMLRSIPDHIAIMNWVAHKKGTNLVVDELGLILAFPKMSFLKRIFLKSLAKLARCYDESSGLVRDRVNFPSGDLDSIPSTGMFCLAMAVAQTQGVVDRKVAIDILTKAHKKIHDQSLIPRAKGLLPHFVRRKKRQYVLPDKSEYSTIDTALYYHAMLLSAEILQRGNIIKELIRDIQEIDFDYLTFPENDFFEGYVTMGLKQDGHTILRKNRRPDTECRSPDAEALVWHYWGGEGALVLCLKKIAGGKKPFRLSQTGEDDGNTGRIYEGRGFIAEIQSLFYPQFNSNQKDDITFENWLKVRRNLLNEQRDSTTKHFPASKAAKFGLYGYSSGENIDGINYIANGTRRRCDGKIVGPMGVIHPHYILMSACTAEKLSLPIEVLKNLEDLGLFPAWGLVENFDPELERSLAFIGSLNASFEVISAYHLLCKKEGKRDVIYEAAINSRILRNAISIFYP